MINPAQMKMELKKLRANTGSGWDGSMRPAIIAILVGQSVPGDGGMQTKRFYDFAYAYVDMLSRMVRDDECKPLPALELYEHEPTTTLGELLGPNLSDTDAKTQ